MGSSTEQDASAIATRRALLEEKVRALAALREESATHAATVQAARAAHEQSIVAMVAQAKQAAAATEVAEAEVRALGLELYQLDPSQKRIVPGVEVKERAVLEYPMDKAFAWAKTAGLCVIPEQLDTKAFAKVAAATTLDFVTKRTEPQVQLAADLTKALAELDRAGSVA